MGHNIHLVFTVTDFMSSYPYSFFFIHIFQIIIFVLNKKANGQNIE